MDKEEMRKMMLELLKEDLGVNIIIEKSTLKVEIFFDGEHLDEDYIELAELKEKILDL